MFPSFDKHFILSAAPFAVPEGWNSLTFAGFTLATAGNLRRHPVTAADGAVRGWVIGWLVGPQGVRPDGEALAAPADGVGYETWSRDFCGRYLCLLTTADGTHVYTDAGGLLPVLYAPDIRAAAAIPTLIRDIFGYGETDSELVRTFDIPRKRGWYPFGLTPLAGVSRLLPNFRLNLADFTVERFWPCHPLQPRPTADAAALRRQTAEIFAAVERSSLALTADPCLVHLTGGFDSRMVLASCFARKDDLTLVTILVPNSAELDVLIAGRIARRCGLRHAVQPYVPPAQEDVELWLTKTGLCIYDHVTTLSRTQREFGDTRQVTGTGGEVGRAFYWSAADIEHGCPPEVDEFLARMGFPATDRLRAAARAWMATLPAMAAVPFWDLAYIEQRMACWAGPAIYGSGQPVPSLTPFNCRAVYEDMVQLPALYRCSGDFARDFIGGRWPQLVQIPFNRAQGLARLRFWKAEVKALLPKGLMKKKEALTAARR